MIQMDTREKMAHKWHILRAFEARSVPVIRSKLYVGDYTLLSDQSTCIDVKQGLREVYSNLVGSHDRFRRECIRAMEAGIRLIILVEEPGIRSMDDVKAWNNPREAQYLETMEQVKAGQIPREMAPKGPPISSKRLARIMQTMAELYGVTWLFCSPEHTGGMILDILTKGKFTSGGNFTYDKTGAGLLAELLTGDYRDRGQESLSEPF
jgi:hypothetical protein